jgi:hypothetical protein
MVYYPDVTINILCSDEKTTNIASASFADKIIDGSAIRR